MPPRTARRRHLIAARKIVWYLIEDGHMKASPRFLMCQFIDVLRSSNKTERQKWIAAHAREWYRRLPNRRSPK